VTAEIQIVELDIQSVEVVENLVGVVVDLRSLSVEDQVVVAAAAVVETAQDFVVEIERFVKTENLVEIEDLQQDNQFEEDTEILAEAAAPTAT
jgi:predicted nucleotidyltransferase